MKNNIRMALIVLDNLIELYTGKSANLDLLIGNGSRVSDYRDGYIMDGVIAKVELSVDDYRLPGYASQLGANIIAALRERKDSVELP